MTLLTSSSLFITYLITKLGLLLSESVLAIFALLKGALQVLEAPKGSHRSRPP